MITLRLDPKLEEKVTTTAKHLGLSRSELIRKSIVGYLRELDAPSAWEAGRDLFGKYASGSENLSRDRKELLRRKIEAKHK